MIRNSRFTVLIVLLIFTSCELFNLGKNSYYSTLTIETYNKINDFIRVLEPVYSELSLAEAEFKWDGETTFSGPGYWVQVLISSSDNYHFIERYKSYTMQLTDYSNGRVIINGIDLFESFYSATFIYDDILNPESEIYLYDVYISNKYEKSFSATGTTISSLTVNGGMTLAIYGIVPAYELVNYLSTDNLPNLFEGTITVNGTFFRLSDYVQMAVYYGDGILLQ